MSNGPYSPTTAFWPAVDDGPTYDSLTDLLSDGYSDSDVIVVWLGDAMPSDHGLRLTIGELRQQYVAWAAEQVIDKLGADPVTFRQDELSLEWGWRLRNDESSVSAHKSLNEAEARASVASAPDLFELVVRHVTAWSTEGTDAP